MDDPTIDARKHPYARNILSSFRLLFESWYGILAEDLKMLSKQHDYHRHVESHESFEG